MSHIHAGGLARKLTLIPSSPEERAKHPLMLTPPSTLPLPIDIFPTPGLPKFDQGQIGSCVANATVKMALSLAVKDLMAAGMVREDAIAQAVKYLLSRMMLYAEDRKAEGTPLTQDSGSQIVTAMRVFSTIGICLDSTFDYSDPETRFTLEPPSEAIVEAALHKALLYFHLPDNESILRCLADGFTLVLGIPVYQYMEDEPCRTNGIIRCPTPEDGEPIGYHCVHINGYQPIFGQRYKRLDNSWGDAVADQGDYYLHDDYPVFDAFTIRRETP